MPLPLSLDLRERIVRMSKRGHTYRAVAKHFEVHHATVSKLVKFADQQGHLNPKPHSGGAIHKKLSKLHFDALRGYLKDREDLTNPELVDMLVEEFGPQVHIHHSQISRVLKAQGITRKKVFYDPKIDDPEIAHERVEWKKMLRKLALNSLCCMVFMDESYVRTHMTRTYGRAPRGKRISARLKHRATRYTLIGAMGIDGMKAKWVLPRGMSDEDMRKYVTEHLIPALGAGRVVIWDNLKAHYQAEVLDAMEQANIMVYFQSRYSPDLNPIEKAWSKLKTLVRGKRPRGAKELRAAVDWAWNQITFKDIRGYFKHVGLLEDQNSRAAFAAQWFAVEDYA